MFLLYGEDMTYRVRSQTLSIYPLDVDIETLVSVDQFRLSLYKMVMKMKLGDS